MNVQDILRNVVEYTRSIMPKPGTYGYELELPVVNKQLRATDATRLMEWARENGIPIEYEFGYCMLEIGAPPSSSLYAMKVATDAYLHALAKTASSFEMYLLGYGGHPISSPEMGEWRVRAPRYNMLETCLPPEIKWFLRVSGEQTHMALSEDRLMEALDHANFLAPLFRSACINSAYLGGKKAPSWIGRDMAYDALPADRVGCQGPFSTLEDYMDWVLTREMLFFLDEEGDVVKCSDRHSNVYHVMQEEATDLFQGDLWQQVFERFIQPAMRMVWPEARISQYLTLEVRSPCAPPPGETCASSALIVGALSNVSGIRDLVGELRERHWDPRKQRVELAKDPTKHLDCLYELVGLAQRQLREMGEENEILDPLLQRLSDGRLYVPGASAQQLLTRGQNEHFLDRFAYHA